MGFKDLRKKIEEASQKYYTDGTSPYTDEEFDSMLEELRQQDPDSKLMNTGHGYSVELDTTPGEKIKHKYGEAGSLTKVHNWKELSNSLKSRKCIIPSLKLDGISIVLYYEKGYLVRAVTRGDGFTGIDVTEKVKIILGDNCDILDKHFTGAVRGELVMSYDNFECYHNIHEDAENPRNTTAGLINKKELSEELRFIDVVVYRIVGIEPDNFHQGNLQKKYTYTLDWLRHNFNNTVYAGLLAEQLTEDNLLSVMDNLRDEWYYKYPADGIVLTDVNLSYDENSYEVSYNSQAFKFPAESKETIVSHVEWNMTKTNYLMPKLIVKTVRLSGTNVSAATGYNAKYILDNKIGPGSVVRISKRGEIIPNVDAVVSCTGAQLPKYCPKCGYPLEFEGVHLCCKNSECANASIQDLLIWSETLAPKDGLGSTLRLKFYEQYFKEVSIDYVMPNLLNVASNIQDTGVQVKTFIASLLDMHENPIKGEDAIKALNIPRLGDKNCKKLAQFPDVVRTLMNYSIMNAHPDAVYGTFPTDIISEVGKANFESIVKNIDKFKRLSYIFDQIIWADNNVSTKGRVAITGKLSCKRSEFVEMLKNYGWEVSDISKDTKFLITDDPNSSSSKNAKAAKLGITKVTEKEFVQNYMK